MKKASKTSGGGKGPPKSPWSGNPYDVWNKTTNQNDVPAAERPCYAFGCPLLGTITDTKDPADSARWFCRHHYLERNHPNGWAEITRKLRLEADQPKPEPERNPYEGWSPQECQAEIKRILSDARPGLVAGSFKQIGGHPDLDPKGWAKVLRVKHESGENLSVAQIEAYKGALGLPPGLKPCPEA